MRSTLVALEAMAADLTKPAEVEAEEDLIGDVEPDDEELAEEVAEVLGEITIVEDGKHAGHEWKSTKSGGFCKTCDEELAAFWKRVDAALKADGRSYKDLRAEAKEAGVTIISRARALVG